MAKMYRIRFRARYDWEKKAYVPHTQYFKQANIDSWLEPFYSTRESTENALRRLQKDDYYRNRQPEIVEFIVTEVEHD